jgi:WD40 repeat protein
MCPEATPLLFTTSQISLMEGVKFSGHTSAITALHIPDPAACLNMKYLFSGARDGTIIIWNIKFVLHYLYEWKVWG